MKENKISDELLDNLDDEKSFSNIRKRYFDFLEQLIVSGNLILIIIALQNVYSIGFPLENLVEELVIISAASFSLFYVYKCYKITFVQNKVIAPPFLKIFHFISLFVALSFTCGLSFEIFNILFSNKHSLKEQDWFMLLLFFLSWTGGICQFYYTNIMSTRI